MAISKSQARKVRQPVLLGDLHITGILDATTTSEIIELSSIAEKITIQSSDSLAGNIELSVNGKDFVAGPVFTAAAIVTYSSNLVRIIKVNRTSGSGRLSLIAR
jgi:hypothetical protein